MEIEYIDNFALMWNEVGMADIHIKDIGLKVNQNIVIVSLCLTQCYLAP